MAEWDITIPAGSTQGSGASGSTALSPSVPGDFDNCTITDVSVVGSPTATVDGTPTDDIIGVRWHIETSGGTAVWGGTGSDAASACFVTIDTSVTSTGTIADGSAPSPAPSTGVSADWDNTDYLVTYTPTMKNDAETISWSAFTLKVTYTPNVETFLSGGPGVGSYTSSGAAVTTLVSEVLSGGAAAGSYTSAGTAAGTLYSEVLTGGAGAGSYTLSGAAATTSKSIVSGAGAGSYTSSGAAATTSTDRISFDNVAFDVSDAFDANAFLTEAAAASTTLTASVGSYSLTGAAANTEFHEVVSAGAGSYTLTGAAAGTLEAALTGAGAGSYTLTGQPANTEVHEVISAGAGSYALTGTAATTSKSIKTVAGTGSYALTGTAANTEFHEVISGGVGSYTLSGAGVTTTTATVTGAGAGSYSLTGTAANTEYHQVSGAGVGSYTLSGAAAATSTGGGVAFDFLAFDERNAFEFDAFAIEQEAVAAAGVGSYALTGQPANTEFHEVVSAGAGSYTSSGASANTEVHEVTGAGVGSYTLSGATARTSATNDISFDFKSFDERNAFDIDAFAIEPESLAAAGVGSYTYSGAVVDTVYEVLAAGVGSYTLNGRQATTSAIQRISFDFLAFSTNAFDPNSYSIDTAVGNEFLTAAPSSYTYTGQATGLVGPGNITTGANFGFYTLTGASVNTWPQVGTTAVPLSVDFANLDPNSPFYGTPGLSDLAAGDIIIHDSLTSDGLAVSMSSTGVFTITGSPLGEDSFDYFIYDVSTGDVGTSATITIQAALVLGSGSYTYTGADVNTEVHEVLTAAVGTYTSTGQDADLRETEIIGAGVGTYALSGAGVTTTKTSTTNAGVGSYTSTGTAATLTETGDRTVTAGAGSYLYTGQDADTVVSITGAVIDRPAGGYDFWEEFARELDRKKREKAKRIAARRKAKAIQDELERQLALEERLLEEDEARKAELARVTRLVAEGRDAIIQLGDERLTFIMEDALERQTFSAMERLERVLTQMHEEDMFLLMATQILVNQ